MARENTRTGGKPATEAIVPGDVCISIGKPPKKAPPGYEWRALTSVARLESGHTPSRKRPEYWGGEVPWIGIRDATGNHGRVIHATNENTNALGIANSSARILPAETVCLSRTASVGYVVVMGRPMATSQDFVNWVCSDELNPHYLKYALLSEQRALRMFAVGSVHSTIYFPEVKAFHLCMPSRKVQDAIAATLGALDNKIELNRKMNATLEAMARALFRDWFVDFGPTRAKMALSASGAKNENEPRARYLSPDLWSLFPDRLDAEGKPEGWEVGTLGNLASLNPESWTARNAPERVTYVDLANTKWGSIDKVEDYAWADAPSRARRILRAGDTIVGTVRPGNGSFCYVGEDGLTGSTGFAVLRPKNPRDRAFVWCAATSAENIDRLAHLADGGAYPAVRPDAVAATEVVIPGAGAFDDAFDVAVIISNDSDLKEPISVDRVRRDRGGRAHARLARDLPPRRARPARGDRGAPHGRRGGLPA